MSETYQQLYNYEAETHESSEHLREHLNQYYDEFVACYGNLNEKQNVKFILMDANGRDALALERGENGQFVKADIFVLKAARTGRSSTCRKQSAADATTLQS